MLNQINEKLIQAKERLRAKRKQEAMFKEVAQLLDDAEHRCSALRHRLEAEKADVERLEGFGLVGLFYTLLGTKEEHLGKERQEYLAANLKVEEAVRAVEHARQELQRLRQGLAVLSGAEAEYERLLGEKQLLLAQAGGEQGKAVLELSERSADLTADQKELREALEAGGRAQIALEQVQSELRSAENWGTWDMLGGGMLVTMAKHSRIDKAKERAHAAQHCLRVFQQELADAHQRLNLTLEMGGFATFADYFFDGLIADWIMQSKIHNASSACSAAISAVSAALSRCRTRLAEVDRAVADIGRQRREIIENA